MKAVIPAAMARRLMARMLAKTVAAGATAVIGRDRRREECTMGKIQSYAPWAFRTLPTRSAGRS